MKKNFVLFLIMVAGVLLVCASGEIKKVMLPDRTGLNPTIPSLDIGSQERSVLKPDLDFAKIPLYFITNKGQVNKKARFYAKTSRYTLWLTREGLVFDSTRKVEAEEKAKSHPSLNPTGLERDVSELLFVNAGKNPEIVPIDGTKLKVNYFIGSNKSQWHCDIPTSKAVLYKNLYKNIDLKVYGIEKQIEYDWLVKPGGNPGDIQFQYKHVKGTRIDDDGNLVIETNFGELIHKKPVAYQKIKIYEGKGTANPGEEKRSGVNISYKKISGNTYGFEIGEYNIHSELIIDPLILVYDFKLAGNGLDIVVDSSGYVYVTGTTYSTNFPTWNSYQYYHQGYDDAFVTKLDTTGYDIIYSTYLGGSGYDNGHGIAVDNSGNAYVTGNTTSRDFPVRAPYQTMHQGGVTDAFIAKIDTTARGDSSLIYSTYLGGNDRDFSRDIVVDSNGLVYVCGLTASENFPTRNQYQMKQGDYDAFVTKLDIKQMGAPSLKYSTFLGGAQEDSARGIARDNKGYIYVVGRTKSSNFPTKNPYRYYQGWWDGFVTKLDLTRSGASSLIYSTYLGGGLQDEAVAIAVDNSEIAYVTGCTCNMATFTEMSQTQDTVTCWDVFAIKLDTTKKGASGLLNAIYLRGEFNDIGYGIAVDSSGYTYVSGFSDSGEFPTLDPYLTDGWGFLAKIDMIQPGESNLIYCTRLERAASGLAVDNSGYVYVTGSGAFVQKFITDPLDPPVVTTESVSSVTPTSAVIGGNIASDGGAPVTARGVCWNTSPLPTTANSHTTEESGIGAFSSTITGLIPNTTYYVRAYATNLQGTAYGNELTFTTSALEPTQILLNRTRLNFGAVLGGVPTGSQGFLISTSRGGDLNWTAEASDTWIQVSPCNGTTGMLVTVSVDVAGLGTGSYSGTIMITAPTADNSPLKVYIYLDIKTPAQDQLPFGTFETPRANAVVYSSIPVSGWVLDDVEVSHVKIYRNPVPGQETGLIYIGDAVFVEGARPDVEQTYPGYPFNYKAGWGYMMLTNFLPNQGNGTFVITAKAADSSGNQVTLGSKTIIADNANAVKPFGAIDTPPQGGGASGGNFVNFGWVLTPKPNTIPQDGSTFKVWVDGAALSGNPVYNRYRQDIASLFPDYNNSQGAGGYYYLDTTRYTNGVHIIQWTARDNAGNNDGIGSRYFTIHNPGNGQQENCSGIMQRLSGNSSEEPIPFDISKIPPDDSGPIHVTKGYNDIEPKTIYPDYNGMITIKIKELQRIEISLSDLTRHHNLTPKNTSSNRYYGYLLYGNELKPLPIGSTLDPISGIFCWQTGPGFIREYPLVFIEKKPGGDLRRKNIKITILHKF